MSVPKKLVVSLAMGLVAIATFHRCEAQSDGNAGLGPALETRCHVQREARGPRTVETCGCIHGNRHPVSTLRLKISVGLDPTGSQLTGYHTDSISFPALRPARPDGSNDSSATDQFDTPN